MDGLGEEEGEEDIDFQLSNNTISAYWFGLHKFDALFYEWAIVSDHIALNLSSSECRKEKGFRGRADVQDWKKVETSKVTNDRLKLSSNRKYFVVLRTTYLDGTQLYSNSDGVLLIPSPPNYSLSLANRDDINYNDDNNNDNDNGDNDDNDIVNIKENNIRGRWGRNGWLRNKKQNIKNKNNDENNHKSMNKNNINNKIENQRKIREIKMRLNKNETAFCPIDMENRCHIQSVGDYLKSIYGDPKWPTLLIIANAHDDDDLGGGAIVAIVAGAVVGGNLLFWLPLLLLCCLCCIFAAGYRRGKSDRFTERVVATETDQVDVDNAQETTYDIMQNVVEFPDINPRDRLSVAP